MGFWSGEWGVGDWPTEVRDLGFRRLVVRFLGFGFGLYIYVCNYSDTPG